MKRRLPNRSRRATILLTSTLLLASSALAQDEPILEESPRGERPVLEPRGEELGFFGSIAEFFSPRPVPQTADEKYALAMDQLEAGNFLEAVTAFRRVLEEHPYSDAAVEAEFRIALSHYFAEQRIDAEDAFAEFRRQHPSHEMLPWALYYEGMTRFTEIGSIDRDQTATRAAIDRFQLFLSRFPDHHLAELVRERIAHCRKILAEHELYIARFYFKVDDYRAAAGRAEEAMLRYPEAGLAPEALLIIGRAQKERQRWPEATEALERLVSEHGDSPEASRARRMLEQVRALEQIGAEALPGAPDESDDRDSVDSFLGPNF